MDQPPTISIVVVSYNTSDMTLACLESIKSQTTRFSFEVLVVDNNSSDGSADRIATECPWVTLIRSQENLGFAGGNNLAAKQAQGQYLLLLNPDTVILDHAIDVLAEFAKEQSGAGIWGGRTLFGDRSLNPASCWRKQTIWNLVCRASGIAAVFKQSSVFNAEAYGGWSRDTHRNVDIVSGCFLLTTKTLWDKLEGFDSAFFMYGEEADYCLRARKLGAQPCVTPHATIIHYGGASEKAKGEKLVRLFTARLQLIRRHWHAGLIWLGVVLHLLWAITRMIAYRVLALALPSRWRDSAKAWKMVWQRRKHWMDPSRSTAPKAQEEIPPESEEHAA